MTDEREKPLRKYEKPAVLRLGAAKASGDCVTGSGDENCLPGTTPSFICITGDSEV